ncbi:colicin D domain-containing protein [Moraxella bovis]|uniref:Colicin-D n=1 Tax=Moraxella bovis TaxID=476 RepID=A0A378PN88_MORBO|nr:colicin D domain-containing protein [Moraxella bovis]STY88591.1 Colicin-D [Moraxella bovis]
MGKLGNIAYNIGTSLNKEDIDNHRQGITPTTQILQNLSTDEQLAYHTQNQALLDENKGRLDGEKESGDGFESYIPPGVGNEACTGVECSDRQIIAQLNTCKRDASQCRDYPEHFKVAASILLPTTKEEVAFLVVTAGGGYVLKVAGKAGVKVIRSFKSGKELDEAVEQTQRAKVEANVANSQRARQSSNYQQFSQKATNIASLKEISPRQLDKKFKHAADFGIVTTKKNTQTINQFGEAIKDHMRSPDTIQFGTYGFVPDSKVFYNKISHNIVVVTKDGSFNTGFRLVPGTAQYENFFKNGVLR